MRISDWSSDVCSSDLDAKHHPALKLVEPLRAFIPVVVGAGVRPADDHHDELAVVDALVADRRLEQVAVFLDPGLQVQWNGQHGKIGRASCRERVCQYV